MRLTVRGGHLVFGHVRPFLGEPRLPMRYWLMKSEPDDCSIDDVVGAPKQTRGACEFRVRRIPQRLAVTEHDIRSRERILRRVTEQLSSALFRRIDPLT